MAGRRAFRVRRCATAAAALALLLAAALPGPAPHAAQGGCPDLIVDAGDLNDIFDRNLGSLRALVDQRSVSIDADSPACYVRFDLSASALAQVGASCRLQGCSSVLFRQRSLALREFSVSGCDAVFDGLGLARRVPSTYADASARIRQHCGADGYEIERVTPVRIGGAGRLRIGFRAAPPAP